MKSLFIAGLAAVMSLAASAAFAQNDPATTLCSGVRDGAYNNVGKMIGGFAKVNVIETTGSIDNVTRATSATPECAIFISQPDAVVLTKKKSPSLKVKEVGVLHREYLLALCNTESGVEDIEDLPGGKDASGKAFSVNIGEEGSGAWALWQNFIAEDESYASIPVHNDENLSALTSVASGEYTCMIVTAAAKGSPVLQEANDNYSDQVSLVEATDWDFNDAVDISGKSLYEFVDFPRTYKNLQGYFGGSRETVSWLARLYVNPAIIDKNQFADLVKSYGKAKPGIQDQYGK